MFMETDEHIPLRAEHTVAITPEDVISWGGNSYGQCGQGERAEVVSVKPRSIKPLQGISIAQVVCGRYHTLCVTATSQVGSCFRMPSSTCNPQQCRSKV